MSEHWMSKHRDRVATELVQKGYIVIDEWGQTQLTEKGKKRAASRLDSMPMGDDILLEIAVCEAYNVTANI